MRVDDDPTRERSPTDGPSRRALVETANNVSRTCAGKPGPVSRTETSTSAFLTSLLIVT